MAYAVAMAVCAGVVFGDLYYHDWAFDDEDYVDNAQVAQKDFSYVLSPDKAWAARPVVHLYFWAVYQIFGDEPGYYHLANVSLHTINALLCSAVVYRMGCGFWTAVICGVLFLINVGHFRAVYWISGVSLLLGTMSGLGSVYMILNYVNSRKSAYTVLSVLCYTAAIFSHEAAVVFAFLPAVILLGQRAVRAWPSVLPYVLIAVIAGVVNTLVYPTPLSQESDFGFGIHISSNIARQVFHLFAGGHLDIRQWFISQAAEAYTGAGMIAVLLVWAYRYRSARLAVGWTLVATLPFLPWPDAPEVYRYYYIPATGACILIALVLVWCGRISAALIGRNYLKAAVPSVLTGVLFATSIIPTDCLQAIQLSYSGLYLQREQENPSRALIQYDKAQLLCPDYRLASRWQLNAAMCRANIGDLEGAYSSTIALIRQYPHYEKIYPYLMQLYSHRLGQRQVDSAKSDLTDDPIAKAQQIKSSLRKSIQSAYESRRWLETKSLSFLYLHYFRDDQQVRAIMTRIQENLRREPNEFGPSIP